MVIVKNDEVNSIGNIADKTNKILTKSRNIKIYQIYKD